MNIFVLDESPILAARDHCNTHVVKMILESAQMLCTAHWIGWQRMLKLDPTLKRADLMSRLNDAIDPQLRPPWKMTHVSHPCTRWAQRTWGNYMWLSWHGLALCDEYESRYGRVHKSREVHRWLNRVIPPTFESQASPVTGTTPFAIAMPDHFKLPGDPVGSYRSYYRGAKAGIAKWPDGKVPKWWAQAP